MITPLTGQIRRGSPAAENLYNLVKQPDVSIIVEIGTWKGMGTTKCILDGITDSHKKNFLVYSLECNKLFHEEAKINLGILPPGFNLIHGSLFGEEKLVPLREKLDGKELSWLEDDINAIRNSKNVLHLIPKKIDLLIIDGGEFSGEIEFNLIGDRAKYLFLDDTTSIKNENNRKYILSHPNEFKVMNDDVANRYLICKYLK